MKQILPILFALLAINFTSNAQTCTALGNETTYGSNDTWIGYVYSNSDLTGYIGYVNQGVAGNPNFDQNFGGDNVALTTNGCSTTTETFSVRYKLNKNFANGNYVFNVAGDDGYRLSLDGGATWAINKWVNQSYTSSSVTVALNGSTNIVLEYYENTGQNRITFSVTSVCIGSEDQSVYGTNNIWNGYVYEGTNFNLYKGLVHEGTSTNFAFDESFGGNVVTYNTSACSITTEKFSVRYRLTKSFPAGIYTFVLGGDDGYRFSLDGGATWAITNWVAHTYASSSYNVTLNGTYNMVIEYFEDNVNNRINFNMIQNSVLPITLMSFTGQQRNNSLDLNWKISDDSNPDYFEVEKSTDGVSFQRIGSVDGTASTSYNYSDGSLSNGKSFYRLKMKDLTGKVIYSNVIGIRINTGGAEAVTVFPSIISGTSIYMETSEAMSKAVVTISDAGGRVVSQKNLGKTSKGQVTTVETSSSKLPAGMYFLQLTNGNENISVKRFIVK